MKESKSRKLFMVFDYVLVIAAALICVLPFVNLLAVSFSSPSYVNAGKVSFWPIGFTTSAYSFVASAQGFWASFAVSVQRVVLGVSLNMILVVLTAYPLSHENTFLPGRTALAWFFVVTMLVGGGLIPTYLVINRLGLLNSIWALVLPCAMNVHQMVIMLNFMRGLPREMEEAALIDGASPVRTLLSVILPVSTPGLATIALFCIVFHWNSWFDGMIYINSAARYPLQTYLRTMVMSPEKLIEAAEQSGGDLDMIMQMISVRTGRAAQLFLGMIPILVIYPFLQKYFTKGLVLGSVKG